MTDTPMRVEIDCSTGEHKLVPLTAEEIAEREEAAAKQAEQRAKQEAEIQAKAEAKVSALAKLATLGLTEAEAQAIVGN